MDDPIKILFKYKNNHRKYQHLIYIFVGETPSKVKSALDKMKDKSLIDTFMDLDMSSIKSLENYYGESWYMKFFNNRHIAYSIKQITGNVKTQLSEKFGKDWITKHIDKFVLADKKIMYSYNTYIKNIYEKKEIYRKDPGKIEKEIDYKYKASRVGRSQFGGTQPVPDDYEELDEDDNGMIDFEEGLEDETAEEDVDLNLEEYEKVIQDDNIITDNHAHKTADLIKKALQDDNIFKKIEKKMIPFDISKDDVTSDEDIRFVFQKNYVTTQYIFKDDTIDTIKRKIFIAIKNNPKFGKEPLILPTRQYLYSEYEFEDRVDQVMIGHKWIKRSNLLQIDIEPERNLRIYEELRGNLKILRDNLKRYGSKIKIEDDNFNILYDYEGYYTNNELFMLDIYNELGKNYERDTNTLKNISDVYVKLYYPKVTSDEFKNIINYLNGNIQNDANKQQNIYQIVNNDLILENQIVKDVETVKSLEQYKKYFDTPHITQSVIDVKLKVLDGKIDLYRIFDNFIVNSDYPFIQYQTMNNQIRFKYHEEDIKTLSKDKENIDILSKWFETTLYGISFKIKIEEMGKVKYTAINLKDNGNIDFKTSWKESDRATHEDIIRTYNFIRKLIDKINNEKNKVKFELPKNEEFKYAYINSIQKFNLPEKYNINHNDLSEFSRYFFPYVSLVIDPRKRQSKGMKTTEASKFGTYLRYKRVSKYENPNRIERRILYLMRNYDYTDLSLINEISKQFNITIDKATEEIERVNMKHPNIKKSRKVLKSLDTVPKYKPPGIGVDIQGKQRDRYKIRISGARDKDQLHRIFTNINVIIYLYIDTYLLKNKQRQILKDRLKKLTNIAKRRKRVNDTVNYDEEKKTVKTMTALDKKRLGFRPEKGHNHWTRSCQNSGKDKRRRPKFYTSVDDLLAEGFKLNSKTGIYEKEMRVKNKKTIIKAVGLGSDGEDIVYYSCNPKDNGEHMYIGFLSKSNNPYGKPMPCCFKIDQSVSDNKKKRDLFLQAIGSIEKVKKEPTTLRTAGDQLYILQDTNKIQEGRYGFLPKYLDFFLNESFNRTHKIRGHYLVKSDGYFFKYGTAQDEYQFFNAVGSVLDLSVDEMKQKLIEVLRNDKNDGIFTAINNGDIRTRFRDREAFINYIETNDNLSFELFNEFISLPSVFSKSGYNIVVFNKKSTVIKDVFEKEKIKNDFTIICQNVEEVDNLTDPNRESMILIKEGKNFYPIFELKKSSSDNKNITVNKKFTYSKNSIIDHILDFYNKNCKNKVFKKNQQLNAKEIYKILMRLTNKDFRPKHQVIDGRNRCKYIITNNLTICPTKPSGSIYNLHITKDMDGKLTFFDQQLKLLNELSAMAKTLKIKPVGVYYIDKTEQDVTVNAIMTEIDSSVPVKEEKIPINKLEKLDLVVKEKQLYDKIDDEILRGDHSGTYDDRIMITNRNEYEMESYDLFRLELSNFINKSENEKLKTKIKKIINDKKMNKNEKRNMMKQILYKKIDKNLYNIFMNQTGGKFVHTINKLPPIKDYKRKNIRDVCEVNKNQVECNENPHCRWSHDNCYIALTREDIIKFINKVSEELADNSIKAYEILENDVSDIVDYNRFTQRPDQKIYQSSNTEITKVMKDLFGKDNIPRIGKKPVGKVAKESADELNLLHPMKNMDEFYVQQIIPNNNTLYRAFANGYTWAKNKHYDIENRNLGYWSELQSDMANYFKSEVITYLVNNRTDEELSKYTNNIKDFISKISTDVNTRTNGLIEYYVLNKIYKIPISIHDDQNNIIYTFDNGVKKGGKINKNHINIKFSFIGISDIPRNIEVIYYK